MTHNALFFATLKRRAGRFFLERSCFFLIKIENFYQKNNFSPIGFFHAQQYDYLLRKIPNCLKYKISIQEQNNCRTSHRYQSHVKQLPFVAHNFDTQNG